MTALVLLLAALAAAEPPFQDGFANQDGLITNQFAYENVGSSEAVRSPDWEVRSGSLFVVRGVGYTGVPDATPPNARSTNGTNSARFRLLTHRADFGDSMISFSLFNEGLTASDATPEAAWDGLHVVARYQDEGRFYYVSVNRRDGTVVIKKKAGEAWYDLSPAVEAAVGHNNWQLVKVRVKDEPDGSVRLALWRDARLLVQARDTGADGTPPYRGAGRVGLRGDNARLKFGRFKIEPLNASPAPAAIAPPQILSPSVSDVGPDSAKITFMTSEDATSQVEYGPTIAYNLQTPWTVHPERVHVVLLTGLQPGTDYHARVRVRSKGPEAAGPNMTFRTALKPDAAAPSITITSPSSGMTLSGSIPLTCSATDDVGIAGVQWQIDGANAGPELTQPPYTVVWQSQASTNGPHTIRATARDASGKVSSSAPVTITITGAR